MVKRDKNATSNREESNRENAAKEQIIIQSWEEELTAKWKHSTQG